MLHIRALFPLGHSVPLYALHAHLETCEELHCVICEAYAKPRGYGLFPDREGDGVTVQQYLDFREFRTVKNATKEMARVLPLLAREL